jgi:hypothetical protein
MLFKAPRNFPFPKSPFLMANKALSKRQKLMIRTDPLQRAVKARDAVPPTPKKGVTTKESQTGIPSVQQKLLKKLLGGPAD